MEIPRAEVQNSEFIGYGISGSEYEQKFEIGISIDKSLGPPWHCRDKNSNFRSNLFYKMCQIMKIHFTIKSDNIL